MAKTNASLIYYRGYTLDGKNLKQDDLLKNLDSMIFQDLLGANSKEDLKRIQINGTSYLDFYRIPNATTFALRTVYPGLLIGIGYEHPEFKSEEKKVNKEKGDFQLGFYFDYTTGMPVIPGSTVKGILKSVFPKQIPKNVKEDEKKMIETINSEKLNYINGLLQLLHKSLLLTETNWEKLFEKGNIFFDAYISEIPSDGKVFAEDYITPHTQGPFKNPIPIRFLKIVPGVTFTFQFKLVETKFEDITIVPEDKCKLFKKILLDFGIGAKRNVGYGNFVEQISNNVFC